MHQKSVEDGHQVFSLIFLDTYSSTSKCHPHRQEWEDDDHLHHLLLSRYALPFIFHSFSFLIFRSFFSRFLFIPGNIINSFLRTMRWFRSLLLLFLPSHHRIRVYCHVLYCKRWGRKRRKALKLVAATSFLSFLPPTSFLLLIVVISSFSFKAGRQFIADLRYYWLMSQGKEEEREKMRCGRKGERKKLRRRRG